MLSNRSASISPSVKSPRPGHFFLPFPMPWPFRRLGEDEEEDEDNTQGDEDKPANDVLSEETTTATDKCLSRRRKHHSSHQGPRSSLDATTKRVPRIAGKSAIFRNDDQSSIIFANVPLRYATYDWELVYSTMRDGISLQTLFTKVRGEFPILLLVRDGRGHTFGCFTSHPWKVSTRYEGTGESFVFKLYPELHIFKWSRRNSYFQLASPSSLAFGGGGAFALSIDSMIERGSSGSCATFNSPCLASSEQFNIVVLEAYRLIPPHLWLSTHDSAPLSKSL